MQPQPFSVIGTPFYVMEFVAGKIYKDPSLPGLSPDERRKVYGAMNQTIAKIHSVDVDKAGIADYGKHGETNYCNPVTLTLTLRTLGRGLCAETGADLGQAVRGQ